MANKQVIKSFVILYICSLGPISSRFTALHENNRLSFQHFCSAFQCHTFISKNVLTTILIENLCNFSWCLFFDINWYCWRNNAEILGYDNFNAYECCLEIKSGNVPWRIDFFWQFISFNFLFILLSYSDSKSIENSYRHKKSLASLVNSDLKDLFLQFII